MCDHMASLQSSSGLKPKNLTEVQIRNFASENVDSVVAYSLWELTTQETEWYSGIVKKTTEWSEEAPSYEVWRNKATDLKGTKKSKRTTESFEFPDAAGCYINVMTVQQYTVMLNEDEQEERERAEALRLEEDTRNRVQREAERKAQQDKERRDAEAKERRDVEQQREAEQKVHRKEQEDEAKRAIGLKRREDEDRRMAQEGNTRRRDQLRDEEMARALQDADAGSDAQVASLVERLLAERRSKADAKNEAGESDILGLLKRILKDKEDKVNVTDSEDEPSCVKSLIRSETRTAKWITRGRWHLYPSRAERLTKTDFEAAWSTEDLKVRSTGRMQFDDEDRIKAAIENIKCAYVILTTMSEGQAQAKRKVHRLYQNSVDDFLGVSIMTVCGDRRESRRTFLKNMFEARVKQTSKEDFCASYDVAIRAVKDKFPQVFQQGAAFGGGNNRRAQTPPRRFSRDQPFQPFQQQGYNQRQQRDQQYQQQGFQPQGFQQPVVAQLQQAPGTPRSSNRSATPGPL